MVLPEEPKKGTSTSCTEYFALGQVPHLPMEDSDGGMHDAVYHYVKTF